MGNFVLVHGAWHGGWSWRRVVQALVSAGHRAHAVTLTGVGERAHLISPDITLETHVTDVINAIQMEEMNEVVLAVHSYAGMIGTAVADRYAQRLKHLVYVDAFVPEPGESWSSTHPASTRETRLAAAKVSPDYTIPAPDPAIYGLSGPDYEWVKRRLTPHPGHTYESPLVFDPVRVGAVPRTYVSCVQPASASLEAIRARVADARLWGGAWQGGGGVRLAQLKTGHDAMISMPAELTKLLIGCI